MNKGMKESVECPKCSSNRVSKNGHKNGKQRYLCKDCRRQFVQTRTEPGYSETFRQICLKDYADGKSSRTIAEEKGVHHTTVLLWVKQDGVSIPESIRGTSTLPAQIRTNHSTAHHPQNQQGKERLSTVPDDSEDDGVAISDRSQKAEAILLGALQVFTAHGYAASSMARIASVAGVSKPTLYSYFQSKEGLFVALVRQLTQNTRRAISQSATSYDLQTSPDKVLRHIATSMLSEFSHSQPLLSFVRLIIGESGRFPDLANTFVQEIEKPILEQLASYMSMHPQLQLKDPEVTARIFAGSLAHYLLVQHVLGGNKVIDLEGDRMISGLANLIMDASSTPR